MYIYLSDLMYQHSRFDTQDRIVRAIHPVFREDPPIPIKTVFNLCGWWDTLWVLEQMKNNNRQKREFALFCAEVCQGLDRTGIAKKINSLHREYLLGKITKTELETLISSLVGYRENKSAARISASSAVFRWVEIAAKSCYHAHPVVDKSLTARLQEKFEEVFCAEWEHELNELPPWWRDHLLEMEAKK